MTSCKDAESYLELAHVVVDVVDVLGDELRVISVVLVDVLNVHRQQVLGERLALGDVHRLRGRAGRPPSLASTHPSAIKTSTIQNRVIKCNRVVKCNNV